MEQICIKALQTPYLFSTSGLRVHGEAARAVALIHKHGEARHKTVQQNLISTAPLPLPIALHTAIRGNQASPTVSYKPNQAEPSRTKQKKRETRKTSTAVSFNEGTGKHSLELVDQT